MLYIGIGNAGTQILDHFRTQAIKPPGLRDASWDNSRLAVADADTNNSVIYKYSTTDKDGNEVTASTPAVQKGDEKSEGSGGQAPPPTVLTIAAPVGVRKLPLDQFWSGGCGVYHIIGQMLAEEVHRRNGITGVLDYWAPITTRTGVSIFISAGGGTGGGGGRAIASILAKDWPGPPAVRIYTVLPAIDQFSRLPGVTVDDLLSITGEDSFQLASAGRFLTKYLNDRFLNREQETDLYLISSGYLSDPPKGLAYSKAVKRLDQFITRTALLLNDGFKAGGYMVAPALGAANRVAEGEGNQPDPERAERAGRRLALSALLPMNLDSEEPTGLSVLPLERNRYEADIRKALTVDSLTQEETLKDLQTVKMLRAARKVHVWAFHNPKDEVGAAGLDPTRVFKSAEATGLDPTRVFKSAEATLKQLFGPNMEVEFNPAVKTNSPRMPPDPEFVLLVLVISPLVDDVYRLVSYYIQSSFHWKTSKIGAVADFIDEALTKDGVTLNDLTQRIGDIGPEEYTPHFWGNFHQLKGKVLQALRRPMKDVTDNLVKPSDVAGALMYLRGQLWHRKR